MKAQFVFMNQSHHRYIHPEATDLVFCLSDAAPFVPGPGYTLQFHPLSKVYEYAIVRSFAQSCQAVGWRVHWYANCSYTQALQQLFEKRSPHELLIMKPLERYQQGVVANRKKKFSGTTEITILPNQQMLIDHDTFCEQFEKPPVMETFYRWMRKQTGVLMDTGRPVGGKRNFDKENRRFDKNFTHSEQYIFPESEGRLRAMDVYKEQLEAMGLAHVKQAYPITTEQAEHYLTRFVEHLLDRFGELEDAMYQESATVHHSLLSVPLNFGLLDPLDVIQTIEQTETAINNKEGYIRQVLGRREYMYHWGECYNQSIYTSNHFSHHRRLPQRFWWPDSSPLQMNCVNHVLQKVHETGYAHHIERLMIIGNFCLLAGFDPLDVNKWFRERFVDAFERVVTPNVLGMSQYADGGKLATKPYIASANYVKKMSNYCAGCVYDPNEKYGENACPLNYLYRHFLDTNQSTFQNARQSFMLNHLHKLDLNRIKQQSEAFFQRLDKGGAE